MALFTESVVEEAALEWLAGVGWPVAAGAVIAPDTSGAERTSYGEVLLAGRLRAALARLNPELPEDALEEAFRKVLQPEGADLVHRNRALHRMLVDGVTVEYRTPQGELRGAQARVIDFDDVGVNDWLAVNQFAVTENTESRRPDVVLFVNGLPLVVVELKNAADEAATVEHAFRQLQTYQAGIPSLFVYNAVLVISDGVTARVGALGAGREWFKPWRTIGGEALADTLLPELEVVVEGMLDRARLLALVRDFVVFDDDGGGRLVKKMAGYHQFHAVQVAVRETLRAAELARNGVAADLQGRYDAGRGPGGKPGDRRVGVVWHTQGSGKSLTMAYYTGRIVREPAMENPTVVVLTDRNDLDEQLFSTFSRCKDLLRQPPRQARDRADLRRLLSVNSGGVVFTTIQKFFPDENGDGQASLSERRNIVVVADEAHRSQYDFIDGFARHMRDALPHASYIGFTGTPIDRGDASTKAVFGDYISVYDIQRAVQDGATVPIYYQARLAALVLDPSERPTIDSEFEEVTEGEAEARQERLKSRWAQLEAVVGADKRLAVVAQDIVTHFEERIAALTGKAMVVCMSRHICVHLYDEIVKLRPAWASGDDGTGEVKVVMTGSATDPVAWQGHIRGKSEREALGRRFRNPDDPLKLVLVRDMWLTGFDAPCLHTMYVDKPMRGHGLMQAIARVNRVFRDKPGGLVVDYLGLAQELKDALATYTESGGTGSTAIDQDEAVSLMMEKYEVCLGLMGAITTPAGVTPAFNWSAWRDGTAAMRLSLMPGAQEHILRQEDGRKRFITAVRELSQAFALSVPHDQTTVIRSDVAFFQAVQAALAKKSDGDARSEEELDHAVRQIIARAVAPEGVVDIFAEAGIRQPDLGILSDEFLAEVRGLTTPNLAVELLRKLLKGEVARKGTTNAVEARSFAQMLEETLKRYQNRSIDSAQVIDELIKLAQLMREAKGRGEQMGLTDDELAFYDALETSDSAVAIMGDEQLREIARDLVKSVRGSVTIDWTKRESVRAQMRVMVRRILRKFGYPPDKQEDATRTVLEQAELLSARWAVE